MNRVKRMRTVLFLCLCLSFAIKSRTQILFDPTEVYDKEGKLYHHGWIVRMDLHFYNPNYHDILKYWKQNNIDNHLPAQFDYGGIHFDSVAVKYKGNSTFAVPNTFNNPKLPFNIDLNEYVGGQNIQGYKTIKLSNVYFDPTFAKEITASYIYKQYLPTYETNLIRLFVNGQYMGVYVNQENVGGPFLQKHFKEKNGAFFKCEPMTESEAGHPVDWPNLLWEGNDTLNYYESYERKSDQGWDEFLNFIDILNNDVVNIESVLNVDRVLWNFAVTQVLSNEDTYNTTIIHNYYMYQTQDGKWQMIPWDLSESFCGLLFTGGTPESHYELDPLYGLSPYFADRPLVYQLLSQPYYRKKYFAHMRTIIDEFYSYSWIENFVLELQDVGVTPIYNDPHRPHDMNKFIENVYDPVTWLLIYKIGGILDVVQNRKIYFDSYADLTYSAPQITNVSQNIQHPAAGEQVFVSAEVNNATSVMLRVTNNDAPYASDFLSVSMNDSGFNGDALAGDGIYTAEVPFSTSNEHIKYYIEAENANAMSLMPERAEYFYYHYYVDQVVSAEENSDAFEVSVYPNPASEFIVVKTEGNFDLEIYNSLGQLVYSEKNLSSNSQIEISNFDSGNYFLVIHNGYDYITKKVVFN